MEFPLLVAILFLSFLAGFCFGCLFCFFGSFLVCVVFDVIAHWTLYWSTTSSFEAADSLDGLVCNYNSACLLRLNVCNGLAKAMKALDGKKKMKASSHDYRIQIPEGCDNGMLGLSERPSLQ